MYKHFLEGKPSEKYPDPFPALSYDTLTPSRKPSARRKLLFSWSASKELSLRESMQIV